MTHLSKKKIDLDIDNNLNNILLELFSKKDKGEIDKILSTLQTPTELEMLKKRIGIIMLSGENTDQQNIRSLLKVTDQTIRRINLELIHKNKQNVDFVKRNLSSIYVKLHIKSLFIDLLETDITRKNLIKKLYRSEF